MMRGADAALADILQRNSRAERHSNNDQATLHLVASLEYSSTLPITLHHIPITFPITAIIAPLTILPLADSLLMYQQRQRTQQPK
jgi:hypothetical protein